MRTALVVCLLLSACGRPRADEPAPSTRRAEEYVASTIGDRFRIAVEPGGRFEHYGVTARDARGRLVVHGTDHATIDLVERTRDSVWLVSPEGRRLVPIVVAPIARGTTTRYTVDQGGSPGRCELSISAVRRTIEVAGVRFDECIDQRRHCVLPAGGALPRETTIDEQETLCPRLGRVMHRMTTDPPLPFEGVAADERSRVVSFAVAGAPRVGARTSLADRMIVLPSDVAAACGGSVVGTELRSTATVAAPRGIPDLPIGSDVRAGDVLLAFRLADAPFTIEARPAGSGSIDDYRGAVSRPAVATPRALVRLTPNANCRNASSLLPLVASLLR